MKNSGEYIISFGFIVFGFVLLFILFDEQKNVPANQVGNSRQKTSSTNVANNSAPATDNFIAKGIQESEGHWQGMEVVPLTQELKTKLKIPRATIGVMIDEVTLNAADSGMLAGDILIAINNQKVTKLEEVTLQSKNVREDKRVLMTVLRNGIRSNFILKSNDILGFSQAETAPMILPSDPRPHPYRGPCIMCHPIGTGGQLSPDPDMIPLPVPPIAKGAKMPHRDRGSCIACHIIY